MTNKKILYCGIINSKQLENNIFPKESDFSFIILGVMHYFFGMDVRKFYNWPFTKNTKKLLVEIKDKFGGLENRIEKLESHVNNLEKNISDLTNQVKNMNSKIDLWLDKKKKKNWQRRQR